MAENEAALIHAHYQAVIKSRYDTYMGIGMNRGRKALIENMHISSDDRVLEVAVGTGLNIRFLQSVWNYTGIDFSSKMLEEAKKRRKGKQNIKLKEANAQAIPFPDSYFSRVFVTWGLSAMPSYLSVVDEMLRVVSYGGIIGIMDSLENIAKIEEAGQIDFSLTHIEKKLSIYPLIYSANRIPFLRKAEDGIRVYQIM